MIDEVLKKVNEAEEAAAKLLLEAEQEAAAIQARADGAYAKQKEVARAEAKQLRASILADAEKTAANNTAAATAAAEAEAEALLSSLNEEIERLSVQMAGRIKNGNC